MMIIIIIIIIIVIIIIISFMQGIYTYTPETNHVPREYSLSYYYYYYYYYYDYYIVLHIKNGASIYDVFCVRLRFKAVYFSLASCSINFDSLGQGRIL